MKETRLDPWVRKISWRKEWLLTPIFLPGEFHEQRRLVGLWQSMGLQRIRHGWVTNIHTHTLHLSIGSWSSLDCCWCLVTKLCLTLCSPMDCSLPGSSVHGIFQARILEWVAISFSRSSWDALMHIFIFSVFHDMKKKIGKCCSFYWPPGE